MSFLGPGWAGRFLVSSNGLGAGNTRAEAIVARLAELVAIAGTRDDLPLEDCAEPPRAPFSEALLGIRRCAWATSRAPPPSGPR